ncbi:MAG: DNA repair protein RecN [Gammaproteobacteria bacterium]
MLTTIHIRDFAIIDELEVELEAGMTALTGETGAGKSILVDALGLALGDRADSGIIRHGSDRAEITAGFDLGDSPDAQSWLEQQDLADGSECIIRRVVTGEGRSRGYINGRPVPMQSLKELGQRLVDIHGQHEHQSLLRRDTQRQLLDDYAGNAARAAELQTTYRQWKSKTAELEALRTAAADRTARAELLRFQVRELEELDLGEGEAQAVDEEHRRLANAGQLLETCQAALTGLYEGEDTVHDRLSRIAGELESLCTLDTALAPARDLLSEASIQLQEAVDVLRRYSDRLDLDPGRLAWLEQRLGAIHDLSRKHHVAADQLPAMLQTLSRELDTLEHADEQLSGLQDRIEALRRSYDEQAAALSRRRREAAGKLNREVTAALQELGMAGARFEIAIQPQDPPRPAANGNDIIEFTVSTNPGQPFGSLSRIASGGELSRMSLGLQVVLAHSTRIPTLIYDEVDTGIGGAVAEVVGRRLRTLGDLRQVLCVTHLPQVAAQAHHHLQVSKHSGTGHTRTAIQPLPDSQRIEEIARMLGGVDISEQSRAHAKEMIGRAAQSRSGKRGKPKNKARA